jgi:hypothetical protein
MFISPIRRLKLNNMQRISDKSRDALYEAVAEEVTLARIKIEKLNIEDKFIKEQIDEIMFRLVCGAPQKALDCFLYEKVR